MSEYHLNLGRRAELKKDSLKTEAAVRSLRDALRLKLDPLGKLEEIDFEGVVNLALKLHEEGLKLQEILVKLAAIKRLIG